MQIKITATDGRGTPGKMADAELIFTEGPLAGLRLIGFAVWERRTGSGYNVTFPARSYSVNGERRTFALLRPTGEGLEGQERIRQAIIDAYQAHVEPAPTAAPLPTLTVSPNAQAAIKRIADDLETRQATAHYQATDQASRFEF